MFDFDWGVTTDFANKTVDVLKKYGFQIEE